MLSLGGNVYLLCLYFLLVYYNVKIVAFRRLGLHPETGLFSICSGIHTAVGSSTNQHNCSVISIPDDTWKGENP